MPDPVTTPEPVLAKTLIPQDLHDRGYVKPWLDKPWTPELASEVFKKLDNAETLVGRKIGIPGPDSKPEEIEKFYGSMRPAKPEEYEYKPWSAEKDEAFDVVMKTAAHKAGLDKRQLSTFIAELAPELQARQKAMLEARDKNVKEFEAIVAKTYGKDNEAVLARVREACKEFVPPELKAHADSLDPKAFAIVAGIVNAILVKYVPEDDLKAGARGASQSSSDKAALQEEARKLIALPAYRDFQNPEHEKTVARVKEIYASPAFKA